MHEWDIKDQGGQEFSLGFSFRFSDISRHDLNHITDLNSQTDLSILFIYFKVKLQRITSFTQVFTPCIRTFAISVPFATFHQQQQWSK